MLETEFKTFGGLTDLLILGALSKFLPQFCQAMGPMNGATQSPKIFILMRIRLKHFHDHQKEGYFMIQIKSSSCLVECSMWLFY